MKPHQNIVTKSYSFSTLERITNTLLLSASFIENLGLMHGKMGISIFFFHLARQNENKVYENYAGELIDEIYEEISANTPVDFENGLAGIGWGIEYLAQNRYIEADTDEVLEEIDNHIFNKIIKIPPAEIGLLDGIVGFGYYYLKRIQNLSSGHKNITSLTNEKSLIYILDLLEKKLLNREAVSLLNNQPKNFDITWFYPIIIWFLAELSEQNISSLKVNRIIQKLIEPFDDNINLPDLQCLRLSLSLALSKLIQRTENKRVSKTINELLSNISRDTILAELLPNNSNIKSGTSGIAWIYKQLFCLNKNRYYEKEYHFWVSQNKFIESDIKNDTIEIDTIDHPKKVFDILEGNTGSMLIELVE